MNETDRSVLALVRAAPDATTIDSTEDYVAAARHVVALRRTADYIASREAEILNPAVALRKVAKEWFGEAKARLDTLEAEAKAVLIAYLERRVVEAASDSKAAIERGDVMGGLALMVAVPAVAGIEIRNHTSFEVVHADLVPDEYWLPPALNLPAVRAAHKEGIVVPGIVSTTKPTLAISVRAADEVQK